MDNLEFYKNLVVHKTIEVSNTQRIDKIANDMVEDYIALRESNEFSYRILLPRNEKERNSAKNIGLNIQLEFLSQLKKKKINVKLREIKYIHDSNHYGWLLLSSDLLKTYFGQK